MLHKLVAFSIALLLFVSCKDDEVKRLEAQQKEQQKQELVFNVVSKNWSFNGQAINASSQKLVQNWAEWRAFLNEINQKPKSSIGAFKKKAKVLSLKVAELNNNIPETYNKPEIKSRIAALTTKINSLNLFINLQNIPEDKLVKLIPEINQELQSLQFQFNEIDQKNQIKMEDGEVDMIRMLDTARAIPSKAPVVIPNTDLNQSKNKFLQNRRKSLIPTP
jgi:hypothetical protein